MSARTQLTPAQVAQDWIRRHSNSTGTRRLVLLSLGWWTQSNGITHPTVDVIAADANVSRKTVFRCLEDLIEAKEIKLVARHGHRATDYRILIPEGYDPSAETFSSVNGDTRDQSSSVNCDTRPESPSVKSGFSSVKLGRSSVNGDSLPLRTSRNSKRATDPIRDAKLELGRREVKRRGVEEDKPDNYLLKVAERHDSILREVHTRKPNLDALQLADAAEAPRFGAGEMGHVSRRIRVDDNVPLGAEPLRNLQVQRSTNRVAPRETGWQGVSNGDRSVWDIDLDDGDEIAI